MNVSPDDTEQDGAKGNRRIREREVASRVAFIMSHPVSRTSDGSVFPDRLHSKFWPFRRTFYTPFRIRLALCLTADRKYEYVIKILLRFSEPAYADLEDKS